LLWRFIDPIAPGPASMFLLIAASYWLAFGTAAVALARYSVRLAMLLPILALLPPAFVFSGIIWRDVLFATVWLLAAAMVFAAAGSGRRLRIVIQIVAMLLCIVGVLLRPNAVFAAPFLAMYIVWPAQFAWKRAAIIVVPAAAVFL